MDEKKGMKELMIPKRLNAGDRPTGRFYHGKETVPYAGGVDCTVHPAGGSACVINLSTEPAEYDAACLENAELLLGTTGTETRGRLAPLEAVIYEAVSPE